ncbi:MAG: hypothetical protein J2P23_15005 [Microlunatus sp.]|nr:hypothetical protein [Microlunatus sp.]
MRQVINVGRMQMINRWVFIGIPLLIMGSALAFVIAIGAVLVPGSSPFYTGAGQAPLWSFIFGGVQALTLTFPFSQAVSITRRAYFVGTTGAFAMLTLGLSILFYLLGLVEKVTGGWFVHGYVFALPWLVGQSWYATILLVWSVAFLLFMIGLFVATIYKRWGITGTVITSFAAGLLLLIIAGAITLGHNWLAFGRWAAALTPLGVSGGVLIVIAALLAASFLILRRAIP